MPLQLFHAAILGLVEGITEFLPVSSTGHLILTSALLFGVNDGEQKKAIDTFEIVIQGGAILAVLGLCWPRVKQMLAGLVGQNAAGLRLFLNLVIAFLPAAVVGLKLHDVIEAKLFAAGPVLAALAVGGVIMILIGRWQRHTFHEAREGESEAQFLTIDQLTWKHALIIGMLQCFALWPGTSRSMVTIVGGMLVGMKPRQSAEFSFLLGLPTLGAACAYKAIKDHHALMSLGVPAIAIGALVAFISAVIAIRFLVSFLNQHGLALFGWYRLALCAALGVLIWRGVVTISQSLARSKQRGLRCTL